MSPKKRSVTLAAVVIVLILAWIMTARPKSVSGSAQPAATPTPTPVPTPVPASAFSTFYCLYPFDNRTPFLQLDPTKKAFVYVGTNPKQFRLAVHNPAGASVVAILSGSTTVPVPNVPATVDVEASKVEVQNNGAQAAGVCYYYVQ